MMNNPQCSKLIQDNLISSPCGAVFKYSNKNYISKEAHIKIVIAHDDSPNKLYVVSTTSQILSAFKYSSDFDDVCELAPSEYAELSKNTFIICSEIEEITIKELIDKCINEFFEVKNRVSPEILNELQCKIVNSKHTPRGYKKLINKCLGQCRLAK